MLRCFRRRVAPALDLRSAIEKMDEGWGVNNYDTVGLAFIHHAASSGDLGFITALCETYEAKVDVRTSNDKSQTALHIACKNDHMDIAVYLVDAMDCNVLAPDSQDMTPLHFAVQANNPKLVTFLLSKGANINSSGISGTALHVAAKHGFKDLSVLLLERQAAMNLQDALGRTALIIAADLQHEAVLRTLLEYGADPLVADDEGNTVLHVACYRASETIVTRLLEREDGSILVKLPNSKKATALHIAVFKGMKVLIIDELLAKGAPLDAKNDTSLSPVHVAAMLNQLEIVMLLVRRGAKLATHNQYGETPLQNAEQLGFHGVVNFLRCMGAR